VLGAEDRVPAGWDLGDRAAAFDADLAARLGPHSDGGAFSQTVSFACELARKPGSGRRLSGSEQIADGSHRHEVPSCGREAWIDMKLGVHEVEQGRCVDHIASHGRSLAGPFGAPFSAAGGANLQVSALRMMAWPVRNALGDALWRSEAGFPRADHRGGWTIWLRGSARSASTPTRCIPATTSGPVTLSSEPRSTGQIVVPFGRVNAKGAL